MKKVWFFLVFLFLILSGCDNSTGSSSDNSGDDEEDPPNLIIGPSSTCYIATSDSGRDVVLTIEGSAVPGLVFNYNVLPASDPNSSISLPSEINLDGFSIDGIITVSYNVSYAGEFVSIDFWTESGSVSSTSYRILFVFDNT